MPKKKLGNGVLTETYLDHLKAEKRVSEGTITTYRNIGKSLPFNILTSQPVVVKKLKDLYDNPNTLQLYLNMIILLRRHNNEEVDKLVFMRNKLRAEIVKSRKESLKDLDSKLPPSDYLQGRLAELTGVRYIINYLMIHHALRNRDINLKYVDKLPSDRDENYIKFSPKTVTLYITDYKTEEKYGDKEIKISDEKFIKELKALNLKDGSYLLPLKDGGKITSTTTFNDKIIRMTIDGLGQNKMVKIVIKDLLNTKSFGKLEQLSKDRGTSLEVLMKSYNLHNHNVSDE
jgi:hypothetical protein